MNRRNSFFIINCLQIVRFVRQRFQLRPVRAAHLLHHHPVGVQLERGINDPQAAATSSDPHHFDNLIWELGRQFFEVRADRFARPAPRRREVDQELFLARRRFARGREGDTHVSDRIMIPLGKIKSISKCI